MNNKTAILDANALPHEYQHHHDGCCGDEHHHHHHDGCCVDEHHHHHHDGCCEDEHHHHDGCCEDSCCTAAVPAEDHTFDNISKDRQNIYIIDGLDCANCAAKMERKIQALPEIQAASITFTTRQLRIAALADPDSLISKMEELCHTIDDGVKIVRKNSTPAAYKEKKSIFRTHLRDFIAITAGGIFFFAGIILGTTALDTAFIFAMFIASYAILGWEVLFSALKNITRGHVFDENLLMSIATIAAFCIGEFSEGVGVMLFYRVGELFEHIAVDRSRSQIMETADMRPETVTLVDGDGLRTIPAADAAAGDIVSVRPGDRIPLDGVVTEGESRIDTSPITGEPAPVKAVPGTEVISGCINIHGVLKIEVQKPLSESMVTRLLDSVENAAAGKPKIDKFITRFAKVYTPVVTLLALLTAVIPPLFTGDWHFWITAAITFLVISCPCAIVISVPLAFFSGIGAASKLGILFKNGLAIEAMNKIRSVVMDKTGTVTKGDFSVQAILPAEGFSEEELISAAASCEQFSTHPIAASIMQKALLMDAVIERDIPVKETAGMGIEAELSGGKTLCGNRKLMDANGIRISGDSIEGTVIYIASGGKYAGSIIISDTLKADAAAALADLHDMKLRSVILTGDNAESAAQIASKINVNEVHANLLPDEKYSELIKIRENTGALMFVGDGINDASVLAGADVGAAMGSGADAAIEAADVVFMNSSVESIPQSISIARYTSHIAMQNIVFALGVKFIVLALGLIGFANIWAAIFADTGVAMLCILNSLRILWKNHAKTRR